MSPCRQEGGFNPLTCRYLRSSLSAPPYNIAALGSSLLGPPRIKREVGCELLLHVLADTFGALDKSLLFSGRQEVRRRLVLIVVQSDCGG